MARRHLKRVVDMAARLARAEADLRLAILEAHESGESVRDIEEYSGISRGRVHRLLQEALAERRQREREPG